MLTRRRSCALCRLPRAALARDDRKRLRLPRHHAHPRRTAQEHRCFNRTEQYFPVRAYRSRLFQLFENQILGPMEDGRDERLQSTLAL